MPTAFAEAIARICLKMRPLRLRTFERWESRDGAWRGEGGAGGRVVVSHLENPQYQSSGFSFHLSSNKQLLETTRARNDGISRAVPIGFPHNHNSAADVPDGNGGASHSQSRR